ncbi:hypothetical protein [Geothrix sp. 21YS21S-2]|uniref:hypothetical protein n=1 Tax=Geothrix sp. 21YS21S-2 TaxID=3068893 RepID=UPI0027BA17BD|nr:hypothetical protein [Geothrix sp. 21YS21S-2]
MRGGATLLMAVAVLALSAAAAWMMQRTVLRELAVEGEALRGAWAALAADSAEAWFLQEGWKALPPRPAPGQGWDARAGLALPVPPGVFPREPAQDGEVLVRFLGPSSRWPGTCLWRLTVVGRVRGPRLFVKTREVYVTVPDERGPPTKRAWRILR